MSRGFKIFFRVDVQGFGEVAVSVVVVGSGHNHGVKDGPPEVLPHETYLHVQYLAVSDQDASLGQEVYDAVELEFVGILDVEDFPHQAEVVVVLAERVRLVGSVEARNIEHPYFAGVVA